MLAMVVNLYYVIYTVHITTIIEHHLQLCEIAVTIIICHTFATVVHAVIITGNTHTCSYDVTAIKVQYKL